jgi:hypothetical protein
MIYMVHGNHLLVNIIILLSNNFYLQSRMFLQDTMQQCMLDKMKLVIKET